MEPCAQQDLVIAKIVSQGALRDRESDDEFSIWFEVEYRGKPHAFQIPTGLLDGGFYTYEQLEAIELELQKLGLDLLPLDHNLIQ